MSESPAGKKGEDTLRRLAGRVRERARSGERSSSYTARLIGDGVEKCAKKFGEEAVEAALACVVGGKEALVAESADTLYHLLVMLESRDVPLEDVYAELERRMGQSGLEEKAGRKGDR